MKLTGYTKRPALTICWVGGYDRTLKFRRFLCNKNLAQPRCVSRDSALSIQRAFPVVGSGMLRHLSFSARTPSSAGRPSGVMREIELDVIRGVAIFLAMGWHFNDLETGILPIDWLMLPGRLFGWAGVDLFFVLSGFLVGRLIFDEYRRTGNFQCFRFLIRRALKIWPILYVFLVCQLLLGFKSWDTYFFQILFHIQNFLKTPILHLWSLAVEEHFYLVVAILFSLYCKERMRSPKSIIYVALAIMIVVPCIRFIAVLLAVDPVSIQWETQYRIDALACGVAMAAMYVFYYPAFQKISRYRMMHLFIVIGGASVLSFVSLHGEFNSVLGYSVAYMTAAAFLFLCYQNPLILRNSILFLPIATAGVYSYAMYIWHPGMIRVSDFLSRYVVGLPYDGAILLFVRYVGAIVIAVAMTKAIERPFLALRDRIFPRSGSGRGPISDAVVDASADSAS